MNQTIVSVSQLLTEFSNNVGIPISLVYVGLGLPILFVLFRLFALPFRLGGSNYDSDDERTSYIGTIREYRKECSCGESLDW